MARMIEEGGRGIALPENVGILIVEPQKFQSDILRNALVSAGVGVDKIVEVRNIQAAREALKNMVPDIVIVELDLPDGPGEDLVRDIRQRRIRAPILAVTSLGSNEHVRGAVEAGVSDYLLKPVSNDQITKRVARHLKKAGLGAPTQGPGRPTQVIIGH